MEVKPTILKHVRVCGNKHTYCAHPLFGEMMYFGGGEIAFMHQHTENVNYVEGENIDHGQRGVHARAQIMLTRSLDGGYTWPESERVVVHNEDLPIEEKRAKFIHRPDRPHYGIGGTDAPEIGPDTWLHFGQSYCGEQLSDGRYQVKNYMTRSDDKGKTWSPHIVEPMRYDFTHCVAAATMVKRPGKLLKPFVVSRDVGADDTSRNVYFAALYSSEDNGATWEYVSEIARDPYHEISHSYAQIVDLGENRLLATTGAWFGNCIPQTRWAYISYSDDLGLNWSTPRKIKAFAISPYPLLLRDGRLLLVYAKRDVPKAKIGLYGMISTDEGKTWSNEFVLRAGDASCGDIGYPEVVELDDGSLFMGYYYCVDDGQALGGARHIAGTIFRI